MEGGGGEDGIRFHIFLMETSEPRGAGVETQLSQHSHLIGNNNVMTMTVMVSAAAAA